MFFGINKNLNDGDSFDIQVNLKNGVTQNVKTMVLSKKLKSNYLNLNEIKNYTLYLSCN